MPATHFINWQQDPFGKYLAWLVIPEATRAFSVDAELIAGMTGIKIFQG